MPTSESKERIPEIAIIGSGMSGLLMGIKLKQAGIDRFTIYEKAPSLGGTWRENTYPGLSCDVPSHYYSYSFELNPNWSHTFSGGAEILQYFKGVAEKYHLLPHIKFNKHIKQAIFSANQWHLETQDQDTIKADILISGCGILHSPRYPDIKGMDKFNGALFHTAQWDHSVAIEGKRIGVIGTGSSGMQTIAPLSEIAGQLVQFQRTPQWIMPAANPQYSQRQKTLLAKVPMLNKLVHHGMRIGFEQLAKGAILKDGWQRKLVKRACTNHLNKIADPVLREKLTPKYEPMCKRLIMSDSYYEAIQKPNVELISDKIAHIEANGVVTNTGQLIELDVIVLATGFHPGVDTQLPHLEGENGITIEQAWQDGVVSYRSLAMPGFPNFFMLLGPYSPIGNFSVISVAETQADYIMQYVEQFKRGKITAMSPRQEVTQQLIEQLKQATRNTIWTTGCDSWYLDKNGDPISWPWSGAQFRKQLKTLQLQDYVSASATTNIKVRENKTAQASLAN